MNWIAKGLLITLGAGVVGAGGIALGRQLNPDIDSSKDVETILSGGGGSGGGSASTSPAPTANPFPVGFGGVDGLTGGQPVQSLPYNNWLDNAPVSYGPSSSTAGGSKLGRINPEYVYQTQQKGYRIGSF